MPQAALRPCAYPTCSELVSSGRCATHAQQQEQGRSNWEVRRWYRTARWRKLRNLILNEYPLCRACVAEGTLQPSTDVDHIIPHRGNSDLFWDETNLQGLCATHHSRKTKAGQ